MQVTKQVQKKKSVLENVQR